MKLPNTRKIGIDARFLLRPMRGIPLYVKNLCEYLPALDPSVSFYYYINKGFEHNDKPDNYRKYIDDILTKYKNVRIINRNSSGEILWEQVYLPEMIRKNPVDVMHFPGNRVCFFLKIPMVVTVHDVIEYMLLKMRFKENLINNKHSLRMLYYITKIAGYVKMIYLFGLKKAKRIITVSNCSANDLIRKMKVPKEKINIIYHGLNDEFRVENEYGENDHSKNVIDRSSRKYVLMLGGDSFQKNSEGAIAAWAMLPIEIRSKYPLRIIGFCGNDASPLLRAINCCGDRRNIQIFGWVSNSDVIENFRKAALFLYLSRYEGFGFPPLQAMASGTPVVASNSSSVPEILGDVGLQFNPDDYVNISHGIFKLLTKDECWADQVDRGIRRARLFQWRKSAAMHLKVYNEVINHGRNILQHSNSSI